MKKFFEIFIFFYHFNLYEDKHSQNNQFPDTSKASSDLQTKPTNSSLCPPLFNPFNKL